MTTSKRVDQIVDTNPYIGGSKSAKGGYHAEKVPVKRPAGPFSHARRRGTVHKMARDEARHGVALKGLLERYFK